MSRPIFTSLSPNAEKDDILLALRLVFKRKKKAIKELEEVFNGISFNSGRSAFLAILKSLGLNPMDEVLVQGFTCNALVNPILWSGLKPEYVDIDKETLNMDPEDLKRKIGLKSRAVVVQHTFGLPAPMDEILETCRENSLVLIEDCAHSLGAEFEGRKVGTFGKAAFFSFGRDKVISSVCGGMAKANDKELNEKIRKFQEQCKFSSICWVVQQMVHPVITKYLVMPCYRFFGLGKFVLIFLQKIKVLSKSVSKEEKRGRKPKHFPRRMNNALAELALHQFKKLDKLLFHQRELARFYDENLNLDSCLKSTGRIYMRYSVFVDEPDKVLKQARKKSIFLDDGWRKTPVVPPDSDQKKMRYEQGSCPNAEYMAKRIINLPTNINVSKKDAQRIIDLWRLEK